SGYLVYCFFFSSRRRHTRWPRDWSSDVCSSDLRCPRRGEVIEGREKRGRNRDESERVKHQAPERRRVPGRAEPPPAARISGGQTGEHKSENRLEGRLDHGRRYLTRRRGRRAM